MVNPGQSRCFLIAKNLSKAQTFTGPLISLDFNFAYFVICTVGENRNNYFLNNL